ncbi:MAG: hypothetical protein ABFD75_11485 [Smithella sp.]
MAPIPVQKINEWSDIDPAIVSKDLLETDSETEMESAELPYS